MATVSSHILDAVSGDSARGIRVQLFLLVDDSRQLLFDTRADDEGRINETVRTTDLPDSAEYELAFHGADYFNPGSGPVEPESTVRVMTLRFAMNDDDRRYHMPVMLSPHSCSVWWSR